MMDFTLVRRLLFTISLLVIVSIFGSLGEGPIRGHGFTCFVLGLQLILKCRPLILHVTAICSREMLSHNGVRIKPCVITV